MSAQAVLEGDHACPVSNVWTWIYMIIILFIGSYFVLCLSLSSVPMRQTASAVQLQNGCRSGGSFANEAKANDSVEMKTMISLCNVKSRVLIGAFDKKTHRRRPREIEGPYKSIDNLFFNPEHCNACRDLQSQAYIFSITKVKREKVSGSFSI